MLPASHTTGRAVRRVACLAGLTPLPGARPQHPGGRGNVGPVTEAHYGEEALLALNLDSARRWTGFAAELAADAGTDPAYVESGTLAGP